MRSSTLRSIPFVMALTALLASGCTTAMSRAGLDSDAETAIRQYYWENALEYDGAVCPAPYIDGITQAHVLDDDGERLTVEIRYLFRDWIKDRRDSGIRDCVDYAGRSFVLERQGDRIEVVEMTGPRRGVPPGQA